MSVSLLSTCEAMKSVTRITKRSRRREKEGRKESRKGIVGRRREGGRREERKENLLSGPDSTKTHFLHSKNMIHM